MINHRFTEPPRMTFMESMHSLLSAVKATVMGGPQAFSSPALYEARLRICETCPKREAIGPLWRCGVCNCLLHLKAGTAVSVCPWYKWPGDERFKPRDFHANL